MHTRDAHAGAGTMSSDRMLHAVRIVGLLLFAFWVWRYMRERGTILHGSILIFHEAGHVLFMPFGEFMMVLGGSLFQLMVPSFFVLYFAHRRDWFAVCCAALYLAASIDNLAAYVADARAGELPLLGGERSNHDWTFLLIETDLLHRDVAIGRFLHNCAVMLFWLSVAAGLYWSGRAGTEAQRMSLVEPSR